MNTKEKALTPKNQGLLKNILFYTKWSHLGSNQGPPDYESGATNQLSYGTYKTLLMSCT